MSFRYDEAVAEGRSWAITHKTSYFKGEEKIKSINFIDSLIEKYGPVIEYYPHWHPLRIFQDAHYIQQPVRFVDHGLHLRDATLLAPYDESFDALQSFCEPRRLLATRLDGKGPYHHPRVQLYLVVALNFVYGDDRYIDRKAAVETMIDGWKKPFEYGHERSAREFTCWESWETMHGFLLGRPCGKRSSVFVDEETGQAIRRLYAVMGQSLGLKEYGRV